MPAIAVNGSDGDVLLDNEGSGVGFPFAASEMRDVECLFTGLERGKRR